MSGWVDVQMDKLVDYSVCVPFENESATLFCVLGSHIVRVVIGPLASRVGPQTLAHAPAQEILSLDSKFGQATVPLS